MNRSFTQPQCFVPVQVSQVGRVSLEGCSVLVDEEAEDCDGLAVLDGHEQQPHEVHQRVGVRRAPENKLLLKQNTKILFKMPRFYEGRS